MYLKKIAVVGVVLLFALGLISSIVSAHTPYGVIGYDQYTLTVDDVNQTAPMKGVNDNTVFAYAVLAYCENQTEYLGDSAVFPSYYGTLSVSNITELWFSYFWLLDYYDLDFVRINNADWWSTGICYEAWTHHHVLFDQLIDEMMHQAYDRDVYVSFTMVGDGEATVDDLDTIFGGHGSVKEISYFPGDNYYNYIQYCVDIIEHCDANVYNKSIFSYDVFNEADSNVNYQYYWYPTYGASCKAQYRAWSSDIAGRLCPLTDHIVQMGSGGIGNMFHPLSYPENHDDYYYATGGCGFDAGTLHYYAHEGLDYSMDTMTHLAFVLGQMLIINEVANNENASDHGTELEIWPAFAAQAEMNGIDAYAWMTLVGTSGYPYIGAYPTNATEEAEGNFTPDEWPSHFDTNPNTTVSYSHYWSYWPRCNDTVNFTVMNKPIGMSMRNNNTNSVELWMICNVTGDYYISIRALGPGGAYAYQNFVLHVVSESVIPSIGDNLADYLVPIFGLFIFGFVGSYMYDRQQFSTRVMIMILAVGLAVYAWIGFLPLVSVALSGLLVALLFVSRGE